MCLFSIGQRIVSLVCTLKAERQGNGLVRSDICIGIHAGDCLDENIVRTDLTVKSNRAGQRANTRAAIVNLRDCDTAEIELCQHFRSNTGRDRQHLARWQAVIAVFDSIRREYKLRRSNVFRIVDDRTSHI